MQILNVWVKKENLEKMLADCGETGIPLDIKVLDKAMNYGRNVVLNKALTKEQRDAKADGITYAFGKTVFDNGERYVIPASGS